MLTVGPGDRAGPSAADSQYGRHRAGHSGVSGVVRVGTTHPAQRPEVHDAS
jgi:hypothetical protein